MSSYKILKQLESLLPVRLRGPVQKVWRKLRMDPELRIASRLCQRDKLALDIGASTGDYSEAMIPYAAGCIAFEANPNKTAILNQRFANTSVTVFGFALSEKDEEIELRIPVQENGSQISSLATIERDNSLSGLSTTSTTIQCRRLDGLALKSVGFMKIDVEGHEISVLKGAIELIDRDHPHVLIEIEERHKPGAIRAAIDFFRERNYHAFFLLGRELLPIEQFDAGRFQNPTAIYRSTVLPGRMYANNFVFVQNTDVLAPLLGRML